MCRCENISIGHGDVQRCDGWFNVDRGGIFSKEMGGHSCVADGLVGLLLVVEYYVMRAV